MGSIGRLEAQFCATFLGVWSQRTFPGRPGWRGGARRNPLPAGQKSGVCDGLDDTAAALEHLAEPSGSGCASARGMRKYS